MDASKVTGASAILVDARCDVFPLLSISRFLGSNLWLLPTGRAVLLQMEVQLDMVSADSIAVLKLNANTTIFSLALSRSSLKQDSLVRDGDVMEVQTKIGC